VTFMGWDPNPWEIILVGSGYIIYWVLLMILFLFNVCLSSYKIIRWIIIRKGIDLRIGFICLSLECICNIIRVIQMIIMPFYNYYHLTGADILITLPACLTMITALLVVFFWLDLTSDPFYKGKFLGIMKIPALIFIILCFIFEIVSDILRIYITINLLEAITSFYTIILAIISIFEFVAAWRIFKISKNKMKSKKRIITYRIIWSGVMTMFGVIMLVIFRTPVTEFPINYAIVWFFIYVSFFVQSLLLITIFQEPKIQNYTTSLSENNSPIVKEN